MWLLLVACNDPSVSKGAPELKVTPASVDFGEVVIGNQLDVGMKVENAGLGFVTITDASVVATSADFSVVDVPTEPLGGGDEGLLTLRYRPDYEGQDYGILTLTTDIEDDAATTADESKVEVNLSAFGVLPQIEVEPEILYFGDVAAGTTSALPFTIASRGSGRLVIKHLELEDPDGVFQYQTPAEYTGEPYSLENGFSITMNASFSPFDDAEHTAKLLIETNDRETPIAQVLLYGNSVDNPNENICPTVQVLSPDNGEAFLTTDTVSLVGYVVDPDNLYSDLDCSWFANGSRLTSAVVDASGNVTGSATLPEGDVEVKLRCIDLEVCSGDDSSSVTVYPADEPLRYTISGGSSIFDYIFVDDDLSIYVNGVEVYGDTNKTKSTLAPIEFEAMQGDDIRVVATDVNQCTMTLDALTLHWGTGKSQSLNQAVCRSACPTDACYDPSYNGPWPGIFFDETYTISIP